MNLNKLGYFFLIQAARLAVVAVFIISLFLLYFIEYPSTAKVSAFDIGSGKKHFLQTINYPGQNIVFIENWVNDTVGELFNFNYTNYLGNLDKMRSRFSVGGFSGFRTVFLASKLVGNTISQKASFSSVVESNRVREPGKFVFVRKNVWEIQIPLFYSMSYGAQISGQAGPDNVKYATIRIKEVPAIEAPLSGLKIESVSLSDSLMEQ